MAFCVNCGKELPEGTRFCANCGTPAEPPKQELPGEDPGQEIMDTPAARTGMELPDRRTQNGMEESGRKPDGKASHLRDSGTEEKRGSILPGLIALIAALLSCLISSAALKVILAVAAVVLAVVSLSKKGKAKGLAIAALVIALLSIGSAALKRSSAVSDPRDTVKTSSGSPAPQKTEPAAKTEPEETAEPEEETASFTLDGITFQIPVSYVSNEDGTFTGSNGNAGFFFADAGSGATDEKFSAVSEELDALMDQLMAKQLTEGTRNSAEESETAGFSSRSYCYAGKVNGTAATANCVLINNTQNNRMLLAGSICTDSLQTQTEENFNKVLDTAKYTGLADTFKTQEAAEPGEPEQEDTGDSEAEDSGMVNPELRAFLDEYEAFVDEYVDFMQKYKTNPADLSLLTEYADIMREYADFMEKIDKYDSETMSTADAIYYLEVTARCSEKLLRVAGSLGA